jgi:hypothetical protein
MFLFSTLLVSFSAFATPEGELIQQRIEQRLPGVSDIGIDANGFKCLVDAEFPRPKLSIKDVKSLVAETFRLNIYNSDLERTTFHASHDTRGGRGGCIYLSEDTRLAFNVYMNSSVGKPCFARAGRLMGSGRMIIRKLPDYKLQFQILELNGDLKAQCTITGDWYLKD